AAAVAGRIQARRTMQVRHAQAGIVGECRQSGLLRGMARLEQRVFDEGEAGFLGVFHAQLGLRNHFERTVGEQLVEFGKFAAVAAGQDDALHARAQPRSSAARCRPINSAMPLSARSSMASISLRRKAWPSAVPCTSMMPPPSFITTFMSVS